MPPSRLVILGDPVAHSLSPRFQNAALEAAGIKTRYEAMHVTSGDLPSVARQLALENAGGNVTVPHKIAFAALCNERTEIAMRAGAVNTFWTGGGRLIGDNTDVGGFDAAAREVLGAKPKSLTVALIGAGGSAAAVLSAIEQWPKAAVQLYGRTPTRAAELASRFGDFVRMESSPRDALRNATLVVNSTPAGMTNDEMPFSLNDVPNDAIIIDLVYRPGGTALTRAAKAAGHTAIDGTTMLVEQGALAFERWFGIPPDRGVMRAALA